MDWKEQLETEAEKEFSILAQKPTAELLEMIRNGNYGRFNKIWKAAGLHGELKDIGWPFYDVLSTTQDEVTRVACAKALISAIPSGVREIKPHQFLDMNSELNACLIRMREILVEHLGEKMRYNKRMQSDAAKLRR